MSIFSRSHTLSAELTFDNSQRTAALLVWAKEEGFTDPNELAQRLKDVEITEIDRLTAEHLLHNGTDIALMASENISTIQYSAINTQLLLKGAPTGSATVTYKLSTKQLVAVITQVAASHGQLTLFGLNKKNSDQSVIDWLDGVSEQQLRKEVLARICDLGQDNLPSSPEKKFASAAQSAAERAFTEQASSDQPVVVHTVAPQIKPHELQGPVSSEPQVDVVEQFIQEQKLAEQTSLKSDHSQIEDLNEPQIVIPSHLNENDLYHIRTSDMDPERLAAMHMITDEQLQLIRSNA